MAHREDPTARPPTPSEGTLTGLLREVLASGDAPPVPWDAALQPGARVGRFDLIREIGRGGHGSVWEARDVELKRKVAFKAIRSASPSIADERALAEAETAAHLSHANIVTLFDVGRSEHGPFLVMELLQGESLSRRLGRGSLAPREALRICTEIARGLAHAHARGVVHRDLTPGNVFLCEGGHVKILDLGIAQVLGRGTPGGGTPGYMSPERVLGRPEDARSDVYSLGVIAFLMLAGRKPAAGAEPPQVPGLPGLSGLVARMLAEDPGGRPSSAGEVLAELEVIGGGAAPASPRAGRRRLLWVAVPAGVLLLSVGGLAAWSTRSQPRRAPAAVAVAVEIPEPVVAVGSSVPLRAQVRDGVGSVVEGLPVTWASADETIAAVDRSGRVTGRAPGTTFVTATSGEASASGTIVVSGREWELVQASSLAPPPAGAVTRNGALSGQGVATVYGRPSWYQTSDWSMLFIPLDLPPSTDAFAIQASYFLPDVVDSGRAVGFVAFTSPGTLDPADLVHGRGIVLEQMPGKAPAFSWGIPAGWTTASITAKGPLAVPITGKWRTLRMEGSRVQCWLRLTLDGEVIHTSTEPCDPTGDYLMLGALHGGGHPVNGAWSDLRVFRGVPVASMTVEVSRAAMSYLHYAKARAVLLDARGNRIAGRVIGWESSDPTTATIDADGAVVGLRKGTVTLTARCEGLQASRRIDVQPLTSPPPAGR